MKYFKLLLLWALLIYANNSIAQTNLTTVEYFIDTDLGYGNGTTILVPAGTTNYANQIVNIDPATVSEGIHTFYIRSKNADGSWSHTNRILFNKPANNGATAIAANLITVEYFVDVDPGYGNGTTITVPAGTTDYANQIVNIDPATVSDGIHTFYIRSKNADGSWSHTNRLLFNKPGNNSAAAIAANLTTVEYFIDVDPGYGNGTTITVPAGTTDYGDQIVNLNPSTITEGIHIFYIRSKNANGTWSHTNKLLFYKPFTPSANPPITNIKYAEYFFDTDPGYFMASPIAITPNTDISNFLLNTNITGLAAGNHRFYIRGIDSIGKWSHTDSMAFTIGTTSPAPAIVVNSINKLVMCARDSFTIGYQATGTYNAGNTFTVQLSDAVGSFASPIIIATKTATKLSDTILCRLPAHINGGTGFLIRVVSSNTAVTGIANSQMLTVRDRPFAQTISGLTAVNGTYTHPYSVPDVATSNYNWITTGGTFTTGTPTSSGNMAWAQPAGTNAIGSLRVVETNQFGCVGDTSALSVNVYRLRINNVPDNLTPCKAFSLNIPITMDGAFGAGNIYTAQLSDATGSFAGPVTIGTLTASGNGINQTGTISATIPANTPNGTLYRIRVVSNNPAFTGSINNAPISIVKPDIGADLARSKCIGFTYNLASDFTDAALTFQYFDNGFTAVNANVNAGTFNVIATNAGGCKDTAQVVVTNFPKPNIGVDITRSKCIGFTYNLAIDFTDASLSYQYFDNGFNVIGANVNAGTFNVIGTNSNGCKDTARVVVTNFPKPNIGADITRSKCVGFTYNLATDFTDASLSYQYFDNGFNVINTNVNTGTFNVIGTNSNGCKDTAQVVVTNFPKPNIGADFTRSKCQANTYNLAIDFTNAALTYQYFDNNFVATNANVNAGVYNVVGTNTNGCKDTAQVTVTNFAQPNTSAISSANTVNVGFANAFSVTNTTGSIYNWSFTNGTQNTGGTTNSVTATFNTAGTQTVSVTETTSDGCVGTLISKAVNVVGISAENVPIGFPACTGANVLVNYTINGNYGTGNIFSVMLSDASGNFATANVIGTLQLDGLLNNATGSISCAIPTSVSAGTGYRTKITASMPVFNGAINSNNLTITEANNTYSLNSDIIINGNLDLSNPSQNNFPCFSGGKIILGNFNLRVNGAITGFDNTHFIVTNGTGSLCINNTASQNNVFPVANNLNSTNFIRINNVGVADVYCVNVTPQVLINGTSGNAVNSSVVKNTWNVSEAIAGGSDATLSVFWNLTDELPSFNRGNCYISHYNGSLYDVQPGSMATGSNPYSITRQNVSSFSPFVVTSSASVLPISLLSFTGKIQNNVSLLKWQTSQEQNSKNFIVQRSEDGIRFNNIGSVDAANNSATVKSYEYDDNVSFIKAAKIYYRLQLNDNNVHQELSNIIVLNNSYNKDEFVVSPNPFHHTIQIRGVFEKVEDATISITDIVGKELLTKKVITQIGINLFEVDVTHFAKGSYILKVRAKGKELSKIILKQ